MMRDLPDYTAPRQETAAGFRVRGIHALIGILAFFGVVFAANGVMVYQAIVTFSGLETADSYKRGRDYNREIEAARAQAALGWSLALSADGNPGHVALDVRVLNDTAGAAETVESADMQGIAARALIRRPARADLDETLMLEARGDGRFTGVAAMALPGCWHVRIELSRDGALLFRQDESLMIGAPAPARCG